MVLGGIELDLRLLTQIGAQAMKMSDRDLVLIEICQGGGQPFGQRLVEADHQNRLALVRKSLRLSSGQQGFP